MWDSAWSGSGSLQRLHGGKNMFVLQQQAAMLSVTSPFFTVSAANYPAVLDPLQARPQTAGVSLQSAVAALEASNPSQATAGRTTYVTPMTVAQALAVVQTRPA